MQKHLRRKKAQPSKAESYMKVNAWRDQQQEDLISKCGQDLAYWTNKYCTGYLIATVFKIQLD